MTTKKNSDTIIQTMRKCLDSLEADLATMEEKVTLRVTQDVFRRLTDGLVAGPGTRVTSGNAAPAPTSRAIVVAPPQAIVRTRKAPKRNLKIATLSHPSTDAARKVAREMALQMIVENKTFTMREFMARSNVNAYVAQSTLKGFARQGRIFVSGKGPTTCYKPAAVLNAELDALIALQVGEFTARSLADALNDSAYRIAVLLHARKGKTVKFIPGSTRVMVRI